MNRDFLKNRLFLGAILVGAVCVLSAEIPMAEAQQSKKVGQLNFQVPEDWPVEKRGGVLAPIPTEEYVSLKFKEIEQEFQAVQEKFSGDFGALESRLKDIEKSLVAIEAVSSQEGAPEGDAPGIRADLELVKSELARLDRKITNKIQEIKAELETVLPEIESIKEKDDDLQSQLYRLEEKIDYLQEESRTG
ncbi:MAG TPA: hypothetical protein PKV41_05445, partial [Candidatus Omnitrophota bacterium]|nr:hypothetical protein [Candidatus Omnitrophota bacterium]